MSCAVIKPLFAPRAFPALAQHHLANSNEIFTSFYFDVTLIMYTVPKIIRYMF